MKTTLKIVLAIVVIVIVLAVAAPFLITQFVDPNDYKDRIASAVKERTGRDLLIDGDIELTVFPWLGVNLGAVALGNAAGFEGAAFVSSERMQVRVKLPPLLARRLEMDTVRIDGLQVNLERDRNGRTNWDDLVALGEKGPESGDGPPAVAALVLGGLDVRNASVSWNDARSGTRYRASRVALQTGEVTLGAPVDFRLEFDLEGGEADPAGHVAVAARIAVDLKTNTYQARGLKLDATLQGGALGAGKVTIAAAGDGTFDQGRQTVSVTGLRIELPAFDVQGTTGSVTVQGALEGSLADRVFTSNGLTITGQVRGQALAGGEAAIEIETEATIDLAGQTLALNQLRFKLPRFDVAGIEGGLSGAGDIAGNLGNRTFAVRGLSAKGEVAGPALQGGKATFELGVNANLDLGRQTVALTGIALSLPAFDIAGTSGRIEITGDIAGNLAERVFAAKGLKLTGGLTGVTGTGGKVSIDLATDARLDLAKGQVHLTGLVLGLPGLDLEPARGSLRVAAESVTGDLGAQRYTFKGLRAKGNVVGKSAFAGKLELDLDTDLDLDLAKRVVEVKRLSLELPAFDVEGNRGKLLLGGAVTADLANRTYRVKGMTAEGSIAGRALRRGSAVFKLGSDAEYDAGRQRFALSGIRLDVPKFDVERLTGGLSFTGNLSGDRLRETYSGQRLALRAVVSGKPVPGRKMSLNIAANAAIDMKQQILELTDLDLGAMGVKATGALKVTRFLDAPAYTGQIATAGFSPRRLLARLRMPRIPTADPKALERATVTATVSGTRDSITLKPLAVTLDESTLTGSLAVLGFARPAYRFDLALDRINADRYLPPKSEGRARAATPGGAAAALPLGLLRTLDAEGRIRIGKLQINNLRLANVSLDIKAANAELAVNPVNANLYRGTYAGNINVRARGREATVTADERITGVEAGPLLRDLRGKEVLSGQADVALKLKATGGNTEQLKRTLTGQGSFSFRDGALKGVDIPGMLCNGLTGLGVISGGGAGGGETRFAEFSGTTDIRQGIVSNDDLAIKSPLLRVRGRGQADLVTQRVDYRVVAGLVASCRGQGGLAIGELSNVEIPIRVTGTFGDLSYAPDFGDVLKAQGTKQLERQLGRILGGKAPPPSGTPAPSGGAAPQDPLEGLLEKGLKGLFGR